MEVVVLGFDNVCEYDAVIQQLQVIDSAALGRNLLDSDRIYAPGDLHVSSLAV